MVFPDPVQILGVNVHAVTWNRLKSYIDSQIRNRLSCEIAYVNVHCMNLAYKDRNFRDILNSFQIVYCDGFGVMLGAKILGHHIPERITGADWIYDLVSFCEKRSHSLYLFGGEDKVAEKAAQKLVNLFPKIRIAGTHHGYFDKSESKKIIDKINSLQADILLIGFGSPLQEKWIFRHRDQIEVPICWVVGAAFDFVAGKVRRGPKWMTNNGMEWAFRFIIEPGRLWQRYLLGNPLFFAYVMKEKFLTE